MNTIRPAAIALNMAKGDDLEREAVRVIGKRGRRLFEMPSGALLTIDNEQTADSPFLHVQHLRMVGREEAEDFFGWSPA